MPVERFIRKPDSVAQLCVAVDDGRFYMIEQPAPQPLEAAVREVEAALGSRLPDGYCSEVNLSAPAWIADMSQYLSAGLAFLIDYGVSRREYYAPDRNAGWLRCHFRHRAHSDPLILPGIQDITAWVDFSVVAEAAVANNFTIAGYVSQAQFLMNGGLAEELADFPGMPPAAQLQLSTQVKLLTLPGEMGESFKCLGISRHLESTPAGLANVDRTFSL